MAMGSALPENPIANGFPQADCTYEPETLVPLSGVYEICHRDEPREWALLLRDDIFKPCKRCGMEVRYKLVRAAPHISEDRDFESVIV